MSRPCRRDRHRQQAAASPHRTPSSDSRRLSQSGAPSCLQFSKALLPLEPCGVDIANGWRRIRRRLSSQCLGEDEILLGATRIAAVSKIAATLAEAKHMTANPREKLASMRSNRFEFHHGGDAFAYHDFQSDGFDVGFDLGDPGPFGGHFGV